MRVHAGLSAALRAALPDRDWSRRPWSIYYKVCSDCALVRLLHRQGWAAAA